MMECRHDNTCNYDITRLSFAETLEAVGDGEYLPSKFVSLTAAKQPREHGKARVPVQANFCSQDRNPQD